MISNYLVSISNWSPNVILLHAIMNHWQNKKDFYHIFCLPASLLSNKRKQETEYNKFWP